MKKKHVDFDDYARDYREIHTKNIQGISGTDSSYFGEFKVKIICNQEKSDKRICILDLGCGDGMNSMFFLKHLKNVDYHGIDVSEESIKQTSKYKAENVNFSVYDGENIPYENQKFDVILLACVLHHVPHTAHRALLSECRRVLKENGHLYIFEHNPLNPVTQKIVKDCPFDEDAVLISATKLKKVLLSLGYNKTTISYSIFFPRKGIFNKVLWLENLMKWLPLGGQYYIKCENNGN